MGQRAGRGAQKRLTLAAAALAALAGLVLWLARPERPAGLDVRGSGALEPALAHASAQLFEPAAEIEAPSLAAAPVPVPAAAPSPSSTLATSEAWLPGKAVERHRPPPCRLRVRVSCGGEPADGIAVELETPNGDSWNTFALGRADQDGRLDAAVEPVGRARVAARSDLDSAFLARSGELLLAPASTVQVALEAVAGRLLFVV